MANRVSADIYSGEWFDIGTVERYDALNKKLGEGLNAKT